MWCLIDRNMQNKITTWAYSLPPLTWIFQLVPNLLDDDDRTPHTNRCSEKILAPLHAANCMAHLTISSLHHMPLQELIMRWALSAPYHTWHDESHIMRSLLTVDCLLPEAWPAISSNASRSEHPRSPGRFHYNDAIMIVRNNRWLYWLINNSFKGLHICESHD
jgi:hypothetical protein